MCCNRICICTQMLMCLQVLNTALRLLYVSLCVVYVESKKHSFHCRFDSVYETFFHPNYIMMFMDPSDLHCASHVTTVPDVSDKLTTSHLYWYTHHYVPAVPLTIQQSQLYDIEWSMPHISLSKHKGDQRESLGLFMKRCQRTSGWQPTPTSYVMYSPSLHAYQQSFQSVFETQHSEQLVPQTSMFLLNTHLSVCLWGCSNSCLVRSAISFMGKT